MSRELKFRVYDKKERCYSDKPFSIDQLGICYIQDEDGYWEEIDEERYVVEQDTGLDDKNGKDIYEGDIVNIEYYEKPFDKKRWKKTYLRKDINIVGFEDGYFKFYTEYKDGCGSELSFSDYGEWSGRDADYKYVAEVIGNIHENPELLGVKE